MCAKFGLSLSNRAVLFGWATLDDLLEAPQSADTSATFTRLGGGQSVVQTTCGGHCDAVCHCRMDRSVKLGTICLASFPLRDPILLAIQWASLDVLSHGHHSGCLQRWGRKDGPQFAHELEVMGVASSERVGR